MSERERWIVYPLLFLALGVGLRDELFDRTWSKNVVCQQLIAMEESPTNPLERRLIAAIGPKGRASLDDTADTGQLSVDTVLAREVVAEKYTIRGGQLDLVQRILQIVLSTLNASAEQWPATNGGDGTVEIEPESDSPQPQADGSSGRPPPEPQ